jgi:hypothetical protein
VYVPFELNVAVPLILTDALSVAWPGQRLFTPRGDAIGLHEPTTLQVPRISPPQGATFPQYSTPASELLLPSHPRSATAIARQAARVRVMAVRTQTLGFTQWMLLRHRAPQQGHVEQQPRRYSPGVMPVQRLNAW